MAVRSRSRSPRMKETALSPEKLSQAIAQLGGEDARRVLCTFMQSASKCAIQDMLLAAAKRDPGHITQTLQAESQVARQFLYAHSNVLQPWHKEDLPRPSESFMKAHTADLGKAEANYELTEVPCIRGSDVFCDCKPDEYEVNYPYAFAEYLKVPAFGRFQGKKVLVMSFPRDDRAEAKVISVDDDYREDLICVDDEKLVFCDRYNAEALNQIRSLGRKFMSGS